MFFFGVYGGILLLTKEEIVTEILSQSIQKMRKRIKRKEWYERSCGGKAEFKQ